jgi:hypothetical protein
MLLRLRALSLFVKHIVQTGRLDVLVGSLVPCANVSSRECPTAVIVT